MNANLITANFPIKKKRYDIQDIFGENNNLNKPVSSYDGVTSLCRCSSVIEARKVLVYVNDGTEAS